MSRRQQIAIYSVIIFMMVWGFDLINAIKFSYAITLKDVFNPFNFSQVAYATTTLFLTGEVLKRYYLPGKYIRLAAALPLVVFFFIGLRFLLEQVIYPFAFHANNYPSGTPVGYYILDNIYYAIIYMMLGFLVFLLDNQIGNQKKQTILLQKNREAELQFLRSQINPHFLFNTLNNIYSLVYEKSDKAPAATLRLSEMMRYMLYEKKETVPLSKEWEYINSFIELQKLRFPHEIPVEIELAGNNHDYEIPPYLLIPFVENAFKHGDFRDHSIPLKISLVIANQELVFRVQNKISYRNKDESGGIGLDNVKRRLELIFPGTHSLDTRSAGMIFETLLVLKM